jgi:hypothetical protein
LNDDSFEILYSELVIFESPDGGQTVYERSPGQVARTLVGSRDTIPSWYIDVRGFNQIMHEAKDNVTLQDALLQLKTLWELTKKDDS